MTDTTKEFAKIVDVKKGCYLCADGGFSCIEEGAVLEVFDDRGCLYVKCDEGEHFLSGQVKEDYYVGLYPAPTPVEYVYAAIAVDEKTGTEGIAARNLPGLGMIPLVCATDKLLPWVKDGAQFVNKHAGTEVRVVKFLKGEVLEVFK